MKRILRPSASRLRSSLFICFIAVASIGLAACAPENKASLPDDPTHEKTPVAPSGSQTQPGGTDAIPSMEAPATGAAAQAVLNRYSFVDPTHLVPTGMLKKAILYFDANLVNIKNQSYITVVDFSQPSNIARFFLVNMHTGLVTPLWVAHGSGSDPQATGYAKYFSNIEGSEMSSLGFYLTAETYSGTHGYSLRIDGLSSTNNNVRKRDIVVHGADYVLNKDIKQGRSWGCFALDMATRATVIDEIHDGSLIYAGLSADDGL